VADHKRTTVRAVVTLTVEVHCTDSWSPDTSLQQVYEQARGSAIGTLRTVIACALDSKTTVGSSLAAKKLVLVGEPVVRQVLAEEERP